MRKEKENLPQDLRDDLERLSPDERRGLERAWTSAASFGEIVPPPDRVAAARMRGRARVLAETAPTNGTAHAVNAPPTGARADRSPRHRTSGFLRPVILWPMAAAASLALILIVVLRPDPIVSVVAPTAEPLAVVLPDGSQVDLNAGSMLTYPRRFSGDRRAVELQGEAYFEVRPGGMPFEVETFNATITVVGTSFNVRAWEDEESARTEVAVATGRVRVAASNQSESVVLEPGQRSIVGEANLPTEPEPENVDHVTSWRHRGFVMTDRPVGAILQEIQRRYAVDIRVEDVSLLDDTISVIVPADADVDTLLQDVAQYVGGGLAREADTYVIRR